jgi:hypothetical protein
MRHDASQAVQARVRVERIPGHTGAESKGRDGHVRAFVRVVIGWRGAGDSLQSEYTPLGQHPCIYGTANDKTVSVNYSILPHQTLPKHASQSSTFPPDCSNSQRHGRVAHERRTSDHLSCPDVPSEPRDMTHGAAHEVSSCGSPGAIDDP